MSPLGAISQISQGSSAIQRIGILKYTVSWMGVTRNGARSCESVGRAAVDTFGSIGLLVFEAPLAPFLPRWSVLLMHEYLVLSVPAAVVLRKIATIIDADAHPLPYPYRNIKQKAVVHQDDYKLEVGKGLFPFALFGSAVFLPRVQGAAGIVLVLEERRLFIQGQYHGGCRSQTLVEPSWTR